MIDLHLHTTFSDGASQAEDIILQAIEYGLEAIAITDHDNTESYAIAKALAASKESSMEVIPGIEINTVWHSPTHGAQEVHVLGFYIDTQAPELRAVIEKHREARKNQIRQMSGKLQEAKLNVSYEDILSLSHEQGSLGRPHVAKALVEKAGVPSISEAFSRYLTPKSATFIRRETVSPHEAVEAIYDSGGIPVIAHPSDMQGIEELVVELIDYGLRGLEAYHKRHTPPVIEFYCTMAEKYDLIVTGGTDFHGVHESYNTALSRLHIPDNVYAGLKAEHQRRKMAQFKVS